MTNSVTLVAGGQVTSANGVYNHYSPSLYPGAVSYTTGMCIKADPDFLGPQGIIKSVGTQYVQMDLNVGLWEEILHLMSMIGHAEHCIFIHKSESHDFITE